MAYTKPLAILMISLLLFHTSPAQAESTIAIMGFENATGFRELEPLHKSIPAILTTDLSGTGLITVVERGRIDLIREEQQCVISGECDERTAQEIGRLLEADYILPGLYTKLGSDIRIDVRLINIASGQITGFSKEGKDENVVHCLSESIAKYLTGKDAQLQVQTPMPLYADSISPQGTSLEKPWYKQWYVWAVVGVIAAGAIAAANSKGGSGGAGGGSNGGSGGNGGGWHF